MYEGLLDGIGALIKFMFILLLVTVPLGIWKLVDIIRWIF